MVGCKEILEAAKHAYSNNTKESITSHKLGSQDFWQISNSVLKKVKSAIPSLLSGPEVLSFASDKTKLSAKNFSTNSNLEGSGISLPVFASRTNLKLPKIVKKVITKFHSSEVSHSDCTPVLVLKNCGPELSYTLAEFIIKCLKKSFFSDC